MQNQMCEKYRMLSKEQSLPKLWKTCVPPG
jgi:hypothetical protein